MSMNLDKIERGVKLILEGMNLNVKDPNYVDTPERYARFLSEIFNKRENSYITFPEHFTEFILFRGHRFYSLCPHHLLPIEFKCSIAYIPRGEVLGLSKLPRLLEEVNDRPLLQEDFTNKVIENAIHRIPGVAGIACLVEGEHGCTHIRGIRSEGAMITYQMWGLFKSDKTLEQRFFELVRNV